MSKITKLLALPVLLFSLVLSSVPVGAVDVLFYSSNGINKFNPDDAGACQAPQAPVTTGIEVGGDNIEQVLTFFTATAGYSLAAAAGIAGNLNAESRLNPAIIQGGAIADENYNPVNGTKGFGLAQWTTRGRQQALVDHAKSKGKPVTDMTTQLEFIVKEMQDGTYTDMRGKLSSNTTDPVAAAAVFHGKTPNIEREGASINSTFAASGAAYGFERSADTSDRVIGTRGGFAQTAYNKYKGQIPDGSGVTAPTDEVGTQPTDGGEILNDSVTCSSIEETDTDIGVGQGEFVDTGEVAGWANVLANSQAANREYGNELVGDGVCAAIVSRVWRGQDIGYGFPPVGYAIDAWDTSPDQIKHADRNVKKGAILLYRTGSRAGHVTIYLGNNKILNDGQIVDADFVEVDWSAEYVGWIDPVDLGWSSIKAADITSVLDQYR